MNWFVLENGEIQGPFAEDALGGICTDQSLIWGPAMSEWISIERWLSEKDEIHREVSSNKNTLEWHLAYNGQTSGPHSKAEIVEIVENIPERNGILLWHQELSDWETVFNFEEILEELGASRRAHPRFNVREMATLTPLDGFEMRICQVITIGQGGFAAEGLQDDCNIGDVFNVKLNFLDTPEPLNCRAIVRNKVKDTYGFQFENLPGEVESAIVEFIQRLNEQGAEAA